MFVGDELYFLFKIAVQASHIWKRKHLAAVERVLYAAHIVRNGLRCNMERHFIAASGCFGQQSVIQHQIGIESERFGRR